MFGHKKKIRYAVVAGGQISQQAFMPGIGRTDNSELTALVTGDPIKADKLAKLYNIKAWTYDQYDALLKSGEVDAVYIATPNFLHMQYAVPALKAGIHVLLEKPMASSVKEAEAIIAAQNESGAKLMIAYRLHHEPGTVEMFTRARMVLRSASPTSRRRAKGAKTTASIRSSSSATRRSTSLTAFFMTFIPRRVAKKGCWICACWRQLSARLKREKQWNSRPCSEAAMCNRIRHSSSSLQRSRVRMR
jgi:hypothetical protein